MPNNVYHVHYENSQLPGQDEDKARFARERAAEITGTTPEEITYFMQPNNLEPTCRLTIVVPQRLTEAVRRTEEAGAEFQFEEPEQPYLDGNSCVIPGSFQVVNFGKWLEPQSLQDHPARQQIIAAALTAELPDLPHEAQNTLNWTSIETNEDTGLAVIRWSAEAGAENAA